MDVGVLVVRKLADKNLFPKVGEAAPDFELVKIEPLAADGKYEDKGKLRFSDYKGKYVILDFWATWCGPCLAKVPELKTLYGKIKDDDRFAMIGISIDDAGSEERLGKFVANREMLWLHGLSPGSWDSSAARTYGINAIPALLLIAPDGKVLLSNPSMNELAKTIDELRKRAANVRERDVF
jgi:thiol-disulfide isomerase/thioredoxin